MVSQKAAAKNHQFPHNGAWSATLGGKIRARKCHRSLSASQGLRPKLGKTGGGGGCLIRGMPSRFPALLRAIHWTAMGLTWGRVGSRKVQGIRCHGLVAGADIGSTLKLAFEGPATVTSCQNLVRSCEGSLFKRACPPGGQSGRTEEQPQGCGKYLTRYSWANPVPRPLESDSLGITKSGNLRNCPKLTH